MSSEAQFWDLYGKLQQSNAAIMQLEDAMRANPNVVRAIGSDVIALRKKQSDMATQFAAVYTAATGETPTGIAGLGGYRTAPRWRAIGLGAGPLLIAAWAAGVIVSLLGVWASFWLAIENTKSKAMQAQAEAGVITEQNRQALLIAANAKDAQAQQAYAAGDMILAENLRTEAQQLRAQAGTPGSRPPLGPQDFFGWFQDNWGYVAAAAAAIFIGPELVRKI